MNLFYCLQQRAWLKSVELAYQRKKYRACVYVSRKNKQLWGWKTNIDTRADFGLTKPCSARGILLFEKIRTKNLERFTNLHKFTPFNITIYLQYIQLFTIVFSSLFFLRPLIWASHVWVFDPPRSGNMFGRNTANGQFPYFVLGHTSCKCRPALLSWAMEDLVPLLLPSVAVGPLPSSFSRLSSLALKDKMTKHVILFL